MEIGEKENDSLMQTPGSVFTPGQNPGSQFTPGPAHLTSPATPGQHKHTPIRPLTAAYMAAKSENEVTCLKSQNCYIK